MILIMHDDGVDELELVLSFNFQFPLCFVVVVTTKSINSCNPKPYCHSIYI